MRPDQRLAMRPDDRVRLLHRVEAANAAVAFVSGRTRHDSGGTNSPHESRHHCPFSDVAPAGQRALGLTALAATEEGEPLASSPLEAVRVGVNTRQSGPLVQDTFTVELRPFEGVEYKYRVEQGGSFVYAWSASADVGFDFHGEPDGAPARYSESYSKGDARTAQGVFIAPTPGIHGWFWENTGAGRVTVTLTTSGFYSASTEYRDGERHERTFPMSK